MNILRHSSRISGKTVSRIPVRKFSKAPISSPAPEMATATAEEVLDKFVNDGSRICIQTGCGAPQHLISKLGPILRKNIEIVSLHVDGKTSYLDKESMFHVTSFFIGPNECEALRRGHPGVSYIPMFLSEIGDVFQRGEKRVGVTLVRQKMIGNHVASVIDDGACIQLGVGAIPNAAALAIDGHRDLRIHTEMFSDGVLELYRRGCITNKFKHV